MKMWRGKTWFISSAKSQHISFLFLNFLIVRAIKPSTRVLFYLIFTDMSNEIDSTGEGGWKKSFELLV